MNFSIFFTCQIFHFLFYIPLTSSCLTTFEDNACTQIQRKNISLNTIEEDGSKGRQEPVEKEEEDEEKELLTTICQVNK